MNSLASPPTPPRSVFRVSVGAILAGALYGFLARSVDEMPGLRSAFLTMTLGFIFLVPLAVGFLTSLVRGPCSWLYRIFAPWLSCLLLILAAFLTGLEGSICIIMAAPVFLVMSSVGGLLHGLLLRLNRDRNSPLCVALVLAAPYLSAALETHLGPPDQIRTVNTQARIAAPPAVVWSNIVRVRLITPAEQGVTFHHRMGFPRPREATLSHEGVGGVRQASFDGGLVFTETITDWQDQARLVFTIRANAADVPVTTLDEHVVVGGRFFDTLEGCYEIEPVADGVILHLSSRHRLSTRFNAYAGRWTDAIMRSIQDDILRIIRARCEKTATASRAAAPAAADRKSG